ncbi:aminotransferase class I/II-fold pyridoxal phosphate-dependent enzyme [Humisphaera borealis]|uniref:8-amino-7-oxononanoate synthase n=1 Tax=Humisphaera borealis TaxID=2807512 RepID=A0A7M2WVA7_9BACT|nr:8-amino-7-oxononanoate synthase [Humisphaera borealis]QOV89319.1 8-amino-7-oxononanoate synthase [Humisphaera borealis]
MTDCDWHLRLARQLAELEVDHRLRRRRPTTPLDAVHVRSGDRTFVNFASNDYLGLARHPRVMEAAIKAVERYGFGSGAAPLLTGYTDAHASAESAIAAWKGTEAAVLFSSGYQANIAVVQMLSAAGRSQDRAARFLLDKLCHASLIDAVRGNGSDSDSGYRVFPHNGITKLQRLLADASAAGRGNVIVTESIFSMDGDAADLPAVTQLYAASDPTRPMLVVDEAHGSGVYGPAGAGWAAEIGISDRVDLSVVTLSKALGGIGAAVCGSKLLCDALVNLARAYVFSTSMPAATAAAAEAAIAVLRDEPHRQQRLRSLARKVRVAIIKLGLEIPRGTVQPDDSPIIPIVLGDESAALSAAAMLQDRGVLALPIRPPTVPAGGCRLRITLSSDHTDSHVEQLIDALLQLASTRKDRDD